MAAATEVAGKDQVAADRVEVAFTTCGDLRSREILPGKVGAPRRSLGAASNFRLFDKSR